MCPTKENIRYMAFDTGVIVNLFILGCGRKTRLGRVNLCASDMAQAKRFDPGLERIP